MRKLFVRSLAIAFVAFALLFGLEFFIEWQRAGFPSWGTQSWAGVNNAKIVDVLSPMARAYNIVLAMLIATIGLAIPLTANMHTPKLIEMFLSDRINRIVLTFITVGAAHVLWVDYMIGPAFAPTWAITFAVVLGLTFLVAVLAVSNRMITASRNEKADALRQKEQALSDAEAQRQRAQDNFIKARVAVTGLP